MVAPRRNGTGVPLAVNTVEIALDEIGYPGWRVIMRTNPRASVYDDLVAADDMGRWWPAFGKVVLSWNFADEEGHAFPHPRDIASEADLDLPYGVIGFIYRQYVDAFRAGIGLPKVPVASSETISETVGGQQAGE